MPLLIACCATAIVAFLMPFFYPFSPASRPPRKCTKTVGTTDSDHHAVVHIITNTFTWSKLQNLSTVCSSPCSTAPLYM